MRDLRLLLTFASLASIATGGLLACDDDGGAGSPSLTLPSNDAGFGTSSSGSSIDTGAPPPSKPSAALAAPAVYLGQVATLDATGSTGQNVSYEWSITAPASSKVTRDSLQNTNTTRASFTPDVLGQYTVTLAVIAGSDRATATTTLDVVDAPVFYFSERSDGGDGVSTAALNVSGLTGADGGIGSAASCFASDAGSFQAAINVAGIVGADWWEAPAGKPSQAVFMLTMGTEAGTSETALFTTSSDATCASAPKVLDSAPANSDTAFAFEIPRISPDGTRVVYLRTNEAGQTRLQTVGLDGSGRHDVAPRGALTDGASDPDSGSAPDTLGTGTRPVWIDNTTFAWIQERGTHSWQVVKAADADNQTPTLLMSCDTPSGGVPGQLDVLPNGDILVSQLIDDVDASASGWRLLVYTPDAAKNCQANPRNLSNLVSTKGAAIANAFALSPDKTKVAFVAYDDATDTRTVRLGPVDGTAAPVVVGPTTLSGLGPRWVAGGTSLTWGVEALLFDAGGSAAVVATSVGTDAGFHPLVVPTPERNVMAIANCGIGYGFGSAASGVGFLGLLGLGLTRRRRSTR